MKGILIGFGASTFVLNTILYFALRDEAKLHGAIQAGMAIFGAMCLLFAILLLRSPKSSKR